ncbi:membrane-bound PQQ-dependent dehydrogenase, glucose/quinate/shikimate family [Pedomonas mirosovicensis]|uniref:membrane-bound PQQ-dependent dehydrogenase, glucose/quinate/shikimate family n=1 Tax=Pedomonas mirosovicensis TaxID=2908641 RepID=UPI00216A42EE|nr:membrane-bound PQQ-dependent dehydrogenase, glucose/quinate/shikimate family [Pedomonas mirosovicensis]MCH8685739.1 membrane-bound PQQ-dependent dehydrogenase, glucose/quinate/shikimate family [Pedomonas mirosovicensis]
MVAVITGWVLLLLGVVLAIGAVWLTAVGGSPFYLLMALGLLITGWLLIRRNPVARWVYAAMLLAVLVWAVWEVGLDWWALVPRGVLLTLIGLWLLLPIIRPARVPADTVADAATTPPRPRDRWTGGRIALAVVVALVGITALISVFDDEFLIEGELPAQRVAVESPEPLPGNDWPYYGGDRFGRRFSTLGDITPDNVDKLEVAWVFHTGDLKGKNDPGETTYEVTPIKIRNTLYLCTPHNHVIALDATTGKVRWRFDPKIQIDASSEHLTCRGVVYHEDAPGAAQQAAAAPAGAPAAAASAPPTAPQSTAPQPATTQPALPAPTSATGGLCARRIITPTMDARLIALDADTGTPCPDFGTNGQVSLLTNIPNAKPGWLMITSTPVIVNDMIVVGGAINDNVSVHSPSGVIRAFDVHTGQLAWNFDPGAVNPNAIPGPGQTYSEGAPNMWSIPSADEALGMVYIPLGNKSPDQWGANRSPQVERFSSAIVALDARTGQLRWVRQTVHHDLWDRDVPSQPTLIDLHTRNGIVPALIGPTKQGDLFVLNRRTGEPIFPVKETRFEGKAVKGDFASLTQPVSALNFTPPPLREADMWGATPFDQIFCRITYRKLYYTGPYTPPVPGGSIIYPGNTGVFNWGGIAVDPARQILIGSPVRLAFVVGLVPRPDARTQIVTQGKAMFGENFGAPYAADIGPFVSPLGVPCQSPPWGSLVGVGLADGKTAWRRRNGTVRDSAPLPLKFNMGVPSLGGPLITAGGVFFYSGTLDNYLRAYDITTGELLWEGRLPAGGQATPMTYRAADNRQMVVVAAGGHGTFGTELGDAIVAFALKNE